jgi:hypothetical protein
MYAERDMGKTVKPWVFCEWVSHGTREALAEKMLRKNLEEINEGGGTVTQDYFNEQMAPTIVVDPTPGITVTELLRQYPPKRQEWAEPTDFLQHLHLDCFGFPIPPELQLWEGQAPLGRYRVWTWRGHNVVLEILGNGYRLPGLDAQWPSILDAVVPQPDDLKLLDHTTEFPFNLSFQGK